jgi:hypothetical protein
MIAGVSPFEASDFLRASSLSSLGGEMDITGFVAQPEIRMRFKRLRVRIFFTIPPRALIIRQFYTI